MSRAELFAAIRPFAPDRRFLPSHVQAIDALADAFKLPRVAPPPPPPTPPKATVKPGGVLAGVMGLAAAATLTTTVVGWESGGEDHLLPYRDIVGVWTQCHGETRGVTALSPAETPEGCAIKLDTRLAGFAQGVVKCTPSLRGRDYQWAAATSLAYNVGTAAYCSSSVDRQFDAGNYRAACDAFLAWDKARVGGKLQAVKGLTNRRRAERDLCLKGATA